MVTRVSERASEKVIHSQCEVSRFGDHNRRAMSRTFRLCALLCLIWMPFVVPAPLQCIALHCRVCFPLFSASFCSSLRSHNHQNNDNDDDNDGRSRSNSAHSHSNSHYRSTISLFVCYIIRFLFRFRLNAIRCRAFAQWNEMNKKKNAGKSKEFKRFGMRHGKQQHQQHEYKRTTTAIAAQNENDEKKRIENWMKYIVRN